jgi:hypothetical protein
MGMYGLQMLFMPSKIVQDHFDAPFTPMLEFWVRGTATFLMTAIAAILQLPTEAGAQTCLFMVAVCGILYPWNAKFGYLTDVTGLVKYPMHYVPELLMLGLSIAGFLSL